MAGEVAEAQKAVMELCFRHPEGVLETTILEKFNTRGKAFGAEVINKLMNVHRLVSKIRSDGARIYMAVGESEAAKRKGLSQEEVLTLQEVGKTGNSGIWTKDLRRKTGLAAGAITKALRTLEQRELVKSVKSVQHGNRKQYMLFDLEPSQNVTGGVWYEGAEFDSAIVDTSYSLCMKCLEDKGQATVEQICAYVNSTGALAVQMQQSEIEKVVTALRYDCQIEIAPEVGTTVYRPARRRVTTSAFASTPCGVCPVIGECTADGHISPQTCVYYDDWLDF